MTTTILAVIALTAPLVPGKSLEFQPRTDYAQALKVAAAEKKPVLVLIGKGDAFAKVMGEGALTGEARVALADKYVCVSVNVETAEGKKLAGEFEMADGGLVISSAGGTYQALRQSGAVSAGELSKHATAYSNAATTPASTVTSGAPPVSAPAPAYYPPSGYTPSFAPPAFHNPIAPAGYSFPSYPAFGCSGST